MKLNLIKKIRNSLFTRLTLSSLATGAMIFIAAGILFSGIYGKEGRKVLEKNLAYYASGMVDRIGTPPDLSKAAFLAAERDIYIEIRGGDLDWKSSKIKFTTGKLRHAHSNEYGDFGTWRGGFFYSTNRKSYGYAFLFNPASKRLPGDFWHLALLLTVIVVITALSHWMIRRMLLPLKDLEEGVRENTNGNLSHRLSIKKDDELGRLSVSFNRMTERLQSMIQSADRMLRDASHELRSPLTRIKLALEFIEDDRTRSLISEDISQIESIITEVLDSERNLNRSYTSEKETISIKKLIEELVSALYMPDNPVAVHTELKDISLSTYPSLLRTAVRNLLQNAVNYADRDNGQVSIECLSRNEVLTIRIRDNGSGISDEESERIFDPFYRTDKSRSRDTGGYGLGLHIAAKSVKAAGGTIKIKEAPGGGAEAVIELPLKS